MLTQIELTNFQSHKNTSIDLDPGVNTFIGTSDHGKSSVMRAVSLVAENKPDGTGFISHWALNEKGKPNEDTRVRLEFGDGTEITRIKGVDNAYVTVAKRGKSQEYRTQEYRAMGKQAPDEVVSLINLSDTNIQRQDQNFFLFAETAGEVIRRINTYTNLGLIDTALSNADRDMRDNRSNTKTARAQKDDVNDKLKAYDILDSLETKYSDAATLSDTVLRDKALIEKLDDTIQRYDQVEENLEAYKDVDKVATRVSALQEIVDKLEKAQARKDVLSTVLNRYAKLKENLDTILPEVDFTTVDGLIQSVEAEREKAKVLRKHIENHYAVKSSLKAVSESLDELHQRYHDEIGDVCPLCGSPIKGDKE